MKRKGFKTSPSIRIPRAAAEKMQAAAAAEVESIRKRWEREIRTQAMIHARETVELSVVLQKQSTALKVAVSLVDAARRNEWTPACEAELAGIKEYLNGMG